MRKSTRKKLLDIARRVPVKLEREELKKIEEDFKKLDKKIEEFERKERGRFKEVEKKKATPTINYFLSGALLLLLVAGIYLVIKFLPKAEIEIITKKVEWNYIDSIVADKNITQIDNQQKRIPAELFSVRKNFNFSFPATGKKLVEQKASGKVTIYNAYSSEPQTLVTNTRFSTPDGKIFRLKERVVVPGAKIIEGKISPSSIEAGVIADQPGSQYNIGPVSRFSLPGFQGSPKYQGFYASSQEAMRGGFIGEKPVPTEDDIRKAREKAIKDLKNYLDSFLSLQVPPEFKIIEGNKQFNLLKEEINKEVNEKGDFTIFLEGESLSIVFRESDLKNLLEIMGREKLGANFKIKDYQLEYGVGRPDFQQGRISFAIDFRSVFEEPFDLDNFKQRIINKTENELRSLVSSFPNIQKITISFWPFWVKKVPDNLKRVKIEVR